MDADDVHTTPAFQVCQRHTVGQRQTLALQTTVLLRHELPAPFPVAPEPEEAVHGRGLRGGGLAPGDDVEMTVAIEIPYGDPRSGLSQDFQPHGRSRPPAAPISEIHIRPGG